MYLYIYSGIYSGVYYGVSYFIFIHIYCILLYKCVDRGISNRVHLMSNTICRLTQSITLQGLNFFKIK